MGLGNWVWESEWEWEGWFLFLFYSLSLLFIYCVACVCECVCVCLDVFLFSAFCCLLQNQGMDTLPGTGVDWIELNTGSFFFFFSSFGSLSFLLFLFA